MEESFNQARRFLEGVPEEEIIADSRRRSGYSRKTEDVEAASVTTTADVVKKATPRGNAKGVHQQKQPIQPPKITQPLFEPSDPVIVDTPMGLWPGMVRYYLMTIIL